MSYVIKRKLPTPEEVLEKLPLSETLAEKINDDKEEIKKILRGEDLRKILVVGPCSAWPTESVIEYAEKLKKLETKVSDKLKIVMRVYIQKPRTMAGWLGPLIQPDPFSEPNAEEGIMVCRKMMLDVLELGLPIADEILFPRKEGYFRNLLSWTTIGARSTENIEHRHLASMLDIAVGMKNPTSGDIEIAINSVKTAQSSNYLALDKDWVKTSGNPYAHLVLRGGNGHSNFGFETLAKTSHNLEDNSIQCPSIIVDASHDNCLNNEGQKDPQAQRNVIMDVLDSMKKDSTIARTVKGFMIESFIKEGRQDVGTISTSPCFAQDSSSNYVPGISITDPCLGWEDTKELVEEVWGRSEV